jgi:hypothetical protein
VDGAACRRWKIPNPGQKYSFMENGTAVVVISGEGSF